MRTKLLRQVQAYIQTEGLFSADDHLLVALSGGADSIALLRILLELGYSCVAAHCNFHLRGEESNRDEAFCQTLCKEVNVKLHVTHFDTITYAQDKGISIEMAARELRYEWFESLCHTYGYTRIAVAHHRDDNVETLLLNLIRGTGLAGLTGIRPINGRIVRPLLSLTRQKIIIYLEALGQEFVTDSTNLQDEYVRNKIRLQIIPLLKKINPQVSEKISETIQHLCEVETIYKESIKEAIQRVTDDTLQTIHIPTLLAEVEPRIVLFEILHNRGFVSAQIDDIFRSLTAESGKCFTNNEWQVLKDRDSLLIRPRCVENKQQISIASAPVEIPLNNTTVLEIKRLTRTPDYCIPRTPNIATLDADYVEFPLTIRQWEKGDKFTPFGMKGRKKLVSDLLTDLKLTLFEKEAQQILTDAHGRIIWVIGIRTSECAKVTEETKEIIEIKIKELEK